MPSMLAALILICLFSVQSWARDEDSQGLQQAIRELLVDGSDIDVVLASGQKINELNQGRYDFKSLDMAIKSAQQIRGLEDFRVLSLVDAVADSGAVEALDVFIERIQNRDVRRWRYLQWNQHDVNAIVKISSSLAPTIRNDYAKRTALALLKKRNELPRNAEVNSSVLYSLKELQYRDPKIMAYILKQLNTTSREMAYDQNKLRGAASSAFVALATPAEVIDVWNGVGVRPDKLIEVQLALIFSLYIGGEIKTNEDILQLLRTASNTSPSPKVREEAKKYYEFFESIHENERLQAEHQERRSKMTPEAIAAEDARMREILKNLFDSTADTNCIQTLTD